MRYSIDLRKRVIDFVEAGGSKAEASRRFSVSRTIIYEWLDASNPFTYEKPGSRGSRALDVDALRKHVSDFPDQTLSERACHFNVSPFCIWYRLKKLGFTRKKRHSAIRNDAVKNAKPIKSNSKLKIRTESH